MLVDTWDDGIHTAIYLPLMLAALEYEVDGKQVTWRDALARRLVETAQELRDRGDDQLTPEDFRIWTHLCTLLRLHDVPAPAAATAFLGNDWLTDRHTLGDGWQLERYVGGSARLACYRPDYPDHKPDVLCAELVLSAAEARRLAALLEGR